MGELGLDSFVADITDVITTVIEDFIITLLSSCYTREETIELTNEFYADILNVTIPGFNTALSDSFAERISELTEQLTSLIWMNIAGPFWQVIIQAINAATAGVGGAVIDAFVKIDETINAINSAIEDINLIPENITVQTAAIQNIIDTINEINIEQYSDICPDFTVPPIPPLPPTIDLTDLTLPTLPDNPFSDLIPEWNPYNSAGSPPDIPGVQEGIDAILSPILAVLQLPPITIDIDIEAKVDEVINVNLITPCSKNCD
jgi:hypothetical protein